MTVITPDYGSYTTPWFRPEPDTNKNGRQQMRELEDSLNTYLSGMSGEEVRSVIYYQNNSPATVHWEDAVHY